MFEACSPDLVGVGGELDTAGLPRPPTWTQRLDDDRVAVQPLGHRHGVVDGADRLAGRDRDVERAKNCFPWYSKRSTLCTFLSGTLVPEPN